MFYDEESNLFQLERIITEEFRFVSRCDFKSLTNKNALFGEGKITIIYIFLMLKKSLGDERLTRFLI